jgi:hypothetical protein
MPPTGPPAYGAAEGQRRPEPLVPVVHTGVVDTLASIAEPGWVRLVTGGDSRTWEGAVLGGLGGAIGMGIGAARVTPGQGSWRWCSEASTQRMIVLQ